MKRFDWVEEGWSDDEEDHTNEDNEQGESSESSESASTVRQMKVYDYSDTSLCPVPSTSTQEKEVLKIGNTIFVLNGRILEPKDKLLSGKLITDRWTSQSTYLWSALPEHSQNAPSTLNVPYVSGTIGAAREIQTELAAFHVYVTEKILNTIMANTNEEIQISQYYLLPKPSCVYPVTLTELKALIGILYLAAVKKDNKVSTSFLWGVCGSDIYNIVMSKERFEYLIRCLRFDDYTKVAMIRKRDSFADFRNMWNEFSKGFSEVFRPSLNCTLGDIFIEFNGDCSFKMPMPNKTDKYGIKLILLCDTNNRYILSGVPYLCKNVNGEIPVAEHIVEKLTKPVRGTNINITYCDDWYNSVPLAKKMLQAYKLTTVGTLDSNNNEVPPDMAETKNRPVGTSVFVYNIQDNLQLCSYYPDKEQLNLYLSSLHLQSVIKEPNGKPGVVEYYESTNDAIDEINNMLLDISCSRRTSQWVVAVFYAILDFVSINAQTILNLNRSRHGIPPVRRVDFLYKLSLDLMIPFIKERLSDPNTDDSIKTKIKAVIEERQKLNVVNTCSKLTSNQNKDTSSSTMSTKPTQKKQNKPKTQVKPEEKSLLKPSGKSTGSTKRKRPTNKNKKGQNSSTQQSNQGKSKPNKPQIKEPMASTSGNSKKLNKPTSSNAQNQENYYSKPSEVPLGPTVLSQKIIWDDIQSRYSTQKTHTIEPAVNKKNKNNKTQEANIMISIMQAKYPPTQTSPRSQKYLQIQNDINFRYYVEQQLEAALAPYILPMYQFAAYLDAYYNLTFSLYQNMLATQHNTLTRIIASNMANRTHHTSAINSANWRTEPTVQVNRTLNAQLALPDIPTNQNRGLTSSNLARRPVLPNTINQQANLPKPALPAQSSVSALNRQQIRGINMVQNKRAICPANQPITLARPRAPVWNLRNIPGNNTNWNIRAMHPTNQLRMPAGSVISANNRIQNTNAIRAADQPASFIYPGISTWNPQRIRGICPPTTLPHPSTFGWNTQQIPRNNTIRTTQAVYPDQPITPVHQQALPMPPVTSTCGGQQNIGNNAIQNAQAMCPYQPSTSVQPVSSAWNSQQFSGNNANQATQAMYSAYQSTMPIQSALSDFNFQPALPETFVQTSNTNFQIPFQNQPFFDFGNEICTCGVCNNIVDKNFAAQCAKCSVFLCNVHRNVLCVNCFTSSRRIALYGSELGPMTAECGICKPQRAIKFSAQCCKCSEFLCLEHRLIVCCFCTDM